MITGDCTRLVQWSMTMPPSQNGTAYLNFISSHDGIGLRPAEGILNQKELDLLVSSIVKLGGKISSRKTPQGKLAAYEMNITVVDALSGDKDGFDEFSLERFMCAHAIMLSLEGVPAIYFNALVGTKNDYIGLEKTKMNRSINRFKWKKDELSSIMDDKNFVLLRRKRNRAVTIMYSIVFLSFIILMSFVSQILLLILTPSVPIDATGILLILRI